MTGATALCKFLMNLLVENQQKQHADRQNPGMTGITGA